MIVVYLCGAPLQVGAEIRDNDGRVIGKVKKVRKHEYEECYDVYVELNKDAEKEFRQTGGNAFCSIRMVLK